MVKPYPPIRTYSTEKTESNPAMLLHGLRFFTDQTVAELLVEMLLVASSPKKIGDKVLSQEQIFPERAFLQSWPQGETLKYATKARLNLKLFAFLSASKLETRHKSHRQHYRDLVSEMRKPKHLDVSGTIDKEQVLETLQNLFLGFQGVGGDRTWCAQAFIPISRSVLAAETLWNESQAERDEPGTWENVLSQYHRFFSMNRHRFLARGGELLYLHLCNALSQDTQVIQSWCRDAGLSASSPDYDPEYLCTHLHNALNAVLDSCPETIGRLATFIDTGIDTATSAVTDADKREDRYAECAWCPAEGWPEGLLFATELLRICSADIDPIKKIELMEVGCAMQVLRALCAQSARYVPWATADGDAGPLNYVWVLSDAEGQDKIVKQVSRRSVKTVQKLLFEAIRYPEIRAKVASTGKADELYKEADTRYSHKYFLTLAKRIGLIVPRRGSGARFTLNETLLRFLVLALIGPGRRVTYETFKNMLFAHYGIAIDAGKVNRASPWGGAPQVSSLDGYGDTWLLKMLDEAGVLVRLSDAHSLVINPFSSGDKPV